MSDLQAIDRYLQETQAQSLETLKSLLRIPSVSADPAYAGDMTRAADSVASALKAAGLEVEMIETDGPPLVYAQSAPVPGKPVALVYGHYDVQPPDPLELWETPPFEPTERNGNLYARGATDDKGQMLTHVESVSAWAKQIGELPLQVKFMIEGEEEMGSEQLDAYLKKPEAKEKLACDVIVISDSGQYSKGQPAITYGLRGIAYFEIHFHGPKQDLHSGSFGGAVNNPANALSKFLASIIDDDGIIQIPGFYDSVKPLEQVERDAWAKLDFNEQQFMDGLGVEGLTGESGYSTLERRWARPTYDVHGLWSGYQGEGSKTIVPAHAAAKFSFRLVPNQTPAEIKVLVEKFVANNTPTGIRSELVDLHGGPGVVVDPNSPFVSAASKAVETAFGNPPVLIREGGSIPIVADMVDLLGADCLLLGWGLEDDGMHSPNEKFNIADFYRGIRASAHLWQHLAS
ncbi:MAG TPA: dipeptidase [Planctomycetaceae bacterium]|nr:dipeptidase [Planctomycetaceae bacterium]